MRITLPLLGKIGINNLRISAITNIVTNYSILLQETDQV